MASVFWEQKNRVLIGRVSLLRLVDDRDVEELTEELKRSVAARLMRRSTCDRAQGTQVLLDFRGVQAASTALWSRMAQLVRSWECRNIDLRLCRVPDLMLVGLANVDGSCDVKLYDSRHQALEAFAGRRTPTSTLARGTSELKRTMVHNRRANAAVIDQGQIAVLVLLLFTVVTGSLVVGCWWLGTATALAPASGCITLDGRPLAGATITFKLSGAAAFFSGLRSSGTTDGSGRFAVKRLQDAGAGAAVGMHHVRISKIVRGFEILPDEYNQASSLKFFVPPQGASTIAFDLRTNQAAAE